MMNDTEGLLFRVWVFLNHFDQVSGGSTQDESDVAHRQNLLT